jgi:hypothetical protein
MKIKIQESTKKCTIIGRILSPSGESEKIQVDFNGNALRRSLKCDETISRLNSQSREDFFRFYEWRVYIIERKLYVHVPFDFSLKYYNFHCINPAIYCKRPMFSMNINCFMYF